MFVNTLGLTERQVRMCLSKTDVHGRLGCEGTGGRYKTMTEKDMKLHQGVK